MERPMSYTEKKIMRPSTEQIERLREELHKRLSIEELIVLRLEALDCVVNMLDIEPVTFYRLWIAPLLDAGLSFEAATSCIVQCYFQPN